MQILVRNVVVAVVVAREAPVGAPQVLLVEMVVPE
jgi:hypothetical protein